MPNWIRLDNNQVLETTDTDPKGRFHPDLKWIKAATSVEAGMVKQPDGSYAFPEPAPENAHPTAPTTAMPTGAAQYMAACWRPWRMSAWGTPWRFPATRRCR